MNYCETQSVDFAEIERYQSMGDWNKAGEVLGDAAYSLEKGGADFIVICTNTMHKVVDDIQKKISIPILHIADATAAVIKQQGIDSVGLLGTKYTMEQDFYRSRLESNGIRVIVPHESDREIVNKIIYEELCVGKVLPISRECYKKVMKSLVENGAKGIILGCTKIGLLVKQEDVEVPVFDTTVLHAIEAVNQSLNE